MKTPEIILGVVKEEMRPPLAPIDQLLEKAKEANDRVAFQALDEVPSLTASFSPLPLNIIELPSPHSPSSLSCGR